MVEEPVMEQRQRETENMMEPAHAIVRGDRGECENIRRNCASVKIYACVCAQLEISGDPMIKHA